MPRAAIKKNMSINRKGVLGGGGGSKLTIVSYGLASFGSYLFHHLIGSCRVLSTSFRICSKVVHFIATIRKKD